MVRGGVWYGHAHTCRSASRTYYGPSSRVYEAGFRLAKGTDASEIFFDDFETGTTDAWSDTVQ